MIKTGSSIFLILLIFGGAGFFQASTLGLAQNSTVTSPPLGWQGLKYSTGAYSYGGKLNDYCYSVQYTSDIGMILVGETTSYSAGGTDVWLVKTGLQSYSGSSGGKVYVRGSYQEEKWNASFGGSKDDGAFSVIQTSDGGYGVAGFTCSFGGGGRDMWLIKTYGNGMMSWNRTYGGPNDDSANCVIQNSDGGYLLAGFTNSKVTSQSSWVVKTDAEGNMLWNQTLPGSVANKVIATIDGGYALAVEYSNAFGLVKIDSFGNIIFNEVFTGPENQASVRAIVKADDGGYAIAGWINSSIGGVGTWLIKTNSLGQEMWNQTYMGFAGYGLTKTVEGGYALTGDQAFLIITDSSGNVEWNQTYDRLANCGSPGFARMLAVLEVTPNHFVMAGYANLLNWQNNENSTHSQLVWIQVAFLSGLPTAPAQITILSPIDGTVYNQRDVPLNMFVNGTSVFLMYRVNGLSNITLAGNSTLSNLANGLYNLTVYATDPYYNTVSQTVTFSLNSTEPYVLPQVTIQSVTNQTTVYTSQPTIDFTVNQPVFWMAYNLDGGDNVTIPSSPVTLYSLSNGNHSLAIYAGDVPGGEAGLATVEFNVSAPSIPTFPPLRPYSPEIPGNLTSLAAAVQAYLPQISLVLLYTSIAMIAVVLVVIFIIIKKESKTQNKFRPT
jgi:hypothetical protein